MAIFISRIFVLLCFWCYEALGCPDGWSTHQSSYYHFSHDKEAWTNAESICKILGGHLVTIDDATETQYLVSQAKLENKSYWIGLNDLQEEGTWVWVNNNAPGTYTNWSTGQPDNHVNNENCALITQPYHFLWNDGQCYSLLNYICEKPAENVEIVG